MSVKIIPVLIYADSDSFKLHYLKFEIDACSSGLFFNYYGYVNHISLFELMVTSMLRRPLVACIYCSTCFSPNSEN